MIDQFTPKTHLSVGYPLDQFLDSTIPLSISKLSETNPPKDPPNHGAIFLPTDDNPGIGNIFITGTPGTGKSTLALQMMVGAATRPGNNAITAYISLENTPDDIRTKAKVFHWDHQCMTVKEMPEYSEGTENSEEIFLCSLFLNSHRHCLENEKKPCKKCFNGESNKMICPSVVWDRDKPKWGCHSPHVRIFSLPPLVGDLQENQVENFTRRIEALERILSAGKSYRDYLQNENEIDKEKEQKNEKKNYKPHPLIFPMVAIDSLNAFTGTPLTRDQLQSLIRMFRRYQTIGVFVIDANDPMPFDSTLADVVIELSEGYDQNYLIKYFEIKKSRHTAYVYGQHPYKVKGLTHIKHPTENSNYEHEILTPSYDKSQETKKIRHGLSVFPSIHYVTLKTESKAETDSEKNGLKREPFFANIPLLNNLVPGGKIGDRHPFVVTVRGPRDTFKTSFALDFLFAPILKPSNHTDVTNFTSLLIRLHDLPLTVDFNMVSPKLPPLFFGRDTNGKEVDNGLQISNKHWELETKSPINRWQNLIEKNKVTISYWKCTDIKPKQFHFIEVNCKTGALLPEELIQLFSDITLRIGKENLQRVVLTDLGRIGVAYPFLYESKTAGKLFLPAFIHIMRNYHVDVLMTGTISNDLRANTVIDQACVLSDTVLTTDHCDVFGESCPIITSNSLVHEVAKGSSDTYSEIPAENTPIVIKNMSRKDPNDPSKRIQAYDLDVERLDGLVGFETKRIKRPEVTLFVFEDNDTIHKKYNVSLQDRLVQFSTLPFSSAENTERKSSGLVIPFTSERSFDIHESIQVLSESAPLDRTVLYTVDDFANEQHLKRFVPRIRQKSDESKKVSDESEMKLDGYYKNLLLAAKLEFGTDGSNTITLQSFTDIWELYKDNEKKIVCDLTSNETMSCLLLLSLLCYKDIELLKLNSKQKIDLSNQLESRLETQMPEITALAHLLNKAKSLGQIVKEGHKLGDSSNVLFIGWFSQLRELIHEFPKTASRWSISPLPHHGFKGDWQIGVMRGSVSVKLGQKIIQSLCKPSEDFNRCIQGVGLPWDLTSHKGKQDSFRAWPGGKCPLSVLSEIHEKALSRKDINNYINIRTILSTVVQVISRIGNNEPDFDNEVRSTILRLPSMMEFAKEK